MLPPDFMGHFLPPLLKHQENRQKEIEMWKDYFQDRKGEYFRTVEGTLPNVFSVLGVDGGLLHSELPFLDLVVVKGAGCVFRYNKGRFGKCIPYPESPGPELHFMDEPLAPGEGVIFSSLHRELAELAVIHRGMDEDVDMVMWDGSLVPHVLERPASDSVIYPLYKRVMLAYSHVFSRAKARGLVLLGVNEDSRQNGFLQMMKAKGAPEHLSFRWRDLPLLAGVMAVGERTNVLSFPKENHPTLKDLPMEREVHYFYLKVAEYDFPLKVDFLADGDEVEVVADGVAEKVLVLSGGNSRYGYPPVLIEADRRAKLTNNLLQKTVSRLLIRYRGAGSFSIQRRHRRPF